MHCGLRALPNSIASSLHLLRRTWHMMRTSWRNGPTSTSARLTSPPKNTQPPKLCARNPHRAPSKAPVETSEIPRGVHQCAAVANRRGVEPECERGGECVEHGPL